jgi:hypothetical protein
MPSVRAQAMRAVGSRGGTLSTDSWGGRDGNVGSRQGGRSLPPRRASNRLVSCSRFVSSPPWPHVAPQPHLERALGGRPRLGPRRRGSLACRRAREGGGVGVARRTRGVPRGRGGGGGLARDHRALVRRSGFFSSWGVIRGWERIRRGNGYWLFSARERASHRPLVDSVQIVPSFWVLMASSGIPPRLICGIDRRESPFFSHLVLLWLFSLGLPVNVMIWYQVIHKWLRMNWVMVHFFLQDGAISLESFFCTRFVWCCSNKTQKKSSQVHALIVCSSFSLAKIVYLLWGLVNRCS